MATKAVTAAGTAIDAEPAITALEIADDTAAGDTDTVAIIILDMSATEMRLPTDITAKIRTDTTGTPLMMMKIIIDATISHRPGSTSRAFLFFKRHRI